MENGERKTATDLPIIYGKDPDRVPAYYKKYPSDWAAEYNMLLMDGVTCKECAHCSRCCTIFGQKEADTKCQFHPNKFKKK